MAKVGTELRDEVAILTLDLPQGNPMTHHLRQKLTDAIEAQTGNSDARAILIQGAGRAFCDGNDLAEYEEPERAPTLSGLCRQIENCPKPVIVALHGNALGAGLEIALAAHFRISDKHTKLGLPEVALGLVPSGGAGQRLPRLLGAGPALELLLNARPRLASDKTMRPLVDALFEGDRVVAGLAFARKLLDDGKEIRRTRDVRSGFADPLTYQEEIARADKLIGDGPETAKREILRCVEAAQLLPFDVGLAFEAEIAEHCRSSAQSRALRHLLRSERLASRPAAARGGRAKRIESLGIVGGGQRAAALAILALNHGQPVNLHVRSDDMANKFEASLRKHFASGSGGGDGDAADRFMRLNITQDLAEVAQSGLVVETTGASPGAVAEVVDQVASLSQAQTIFAVTSGREALVQASELTRARGRVLGLRLRDPANLARLIEVACPDTCDRDSLATFIQWAETMGRVTVTTQPRAMGVGRELTRCWQAMALALTDEGVHPFQIDQALMEFGHKAGPFLAMDQEGLEVVRDDINALGMPVSECLDALIAAGRLGRHRGHGLYLYPEGAARPLPDESIDDVLSKPRSNRLDDSVIVHLCNAALANRGAHLLGSGQIERASDLDVALVAGWGYPRLRGGPMISADIAGLFQVQRLLDQFQKTTGEARWATDSHLKELVKNGESFVRRK